MLALHIVRTLAGGGEGSKEAHKIAYSQYYVFARGGGRGSKTCIPTMYAAR